jgi:hypothetical protein
MAEGEGFEPPVPFRVQWFSRPFKGGRGIRPSQFTPIESAFFEDHDGAYWDQSASGHGQKADSAFSQLPLKNAGAIPIRRLWSRDGPTVLDRLRRVAYLQKIARIFGRLRLEAVSVCRIRIFVNRRLSLDHLRIA